MKDNVLCDHDKCEEWLTISKIPPVLKDHNLLFTIVAFDDGVDVASKEEMK